MKNTIEWARKPIVAFTAFAALGAPALGACTGESKPPIPLCGIAISNIEQPPQVDRITVTRNPDGSFGPPVSAELLDRVKAATVKIQYMRQVGFKQVEARNGSGVIVNGRIITAAHVISGLDPSKIVVTRVDGTEIPLSKNSYDHCFEFVTDGRRTEPLDTHEHSSLDAAILTPADATEGLTLGSSERGWGIYGGYGGGAAEFGLGLQIITGSNKDFPTGQIITGLNGAPTQVGDSGGPLVSLDGECTGIVTGYYMTPIDHQTLHNNYGVTIEPGQYQLSSVVVADDLRAMMAQLDARKGASPPPR